MASEEQYSSSNVNVKFNEQEPWTREDIIEIYRLYQNGLSLKRISRFLGRSKSACEVVMNKIMIQQLLHHPYKEVEDHYDDDDTIQHLLESKYYVPLDPVLACVKPHPERQEPWGLWIYVFIVVCIIGYGKIADINS